MQMKFRVWHGRSTVLFTQTTATNNGWAPAVPTPTPGVVVGKIEFNNSCSRGLFAVQNFAEHAVLGDYVGELIQRGHLGRSGSSYACGGFDPTVVNSYVEISAEFGGNEL